MCDLHTRCWLWTAACNQAGYGRVGSGGRGHAMQAHRASWLIHHRSLPDLDVLHTCDTPSCVRPDHLFLGTDYTNQRDMMRKGRASGLSTKASSL